jgi:hypothetical protein
VLVLGWFLVVEVAVRALLVPASQDLREIRAYDERAQRLVNGHGLRLAVVGNSAARCGIDADLLRQALAANGSGTPDVAAFTPDGSGIVDWCCLLNRFFWEPDRTPDAVVICFFGGLQDHRSDSGRLVHYLATRGDWPALFCRGYCSVGERIDFVLSTFWTTYALRARLRDRLLKTAVPDFEAFHTTLNDVAYRQEQAAASRAASYRRTYFFLQRLLAAARTQRTQLVFVAFPGRPDGGASRSTYPIPDEVRTWIREAGMQLVDLRRVEQLTPALYRDAVHLKPEGQRVFTKVLAARLAHLTISRSVAGK